MLLNSESCKIITQNLENDIRGKNTLIKDKNETQIPQLKNQLKEIEEEIKLKPEDRLTTCQTNNTNLGKPSKQIWESLVNSLVVCYSFWIQKDNINSICWIVSLRN